jgi:hypothetical protein
MSEKILSNNNCISLGSIDGEADLALRPGAININPPPQGGRCDCCGRHISKLSPFGKASDPLVGDFEGALLVKRWRPGGPYDEEAGKAMQEAERCYENDGYKDPLGWMINKYGKEKGESLYYTMMLWDQTGSSWECRDCSILDEDEFFIRLLK